jgi:hypothetical protein
MVVHIVKLCVGADSIEELQAFQAWQMEQALKARAAAGGPRLAPVCGTRAWPKRKPDVLAGGSLYWVIKGVILVRQKIIAIEPVTDDHGERCGLYLDAQLVRTEPRAKRPFQGWRYLETGDAPADLGAVAGGAELPDEIRRQLVDLGAW